MGSHGNGQVSTVMIQEEVTPNNIHADMEMFGGKHLTSLHFLLIYFGSEHAEQPKNIKGFKLLTMADKNRYRTLDFGQRSQDSVSNSKTGMEILLGKP